MGEKARVDNYYVNKQKVGESGVEAILGGLVGVSLTSVTGSAGTTEVAFHTITVPAKFLNVDGRGVRIKASGSFAANGNTKTIKTYFGAQSISSGAVTHNAKNWLMELEVFRTGAATQVNRGRYSADGTADVVAIGTGTDDLTAAVIVKITGTGATSGADIIISNLTVELI